MKMSSYFKLDLGCCCSRPELLVHALALARKETFDPSMPQNVTFYESDERTHSPEIYFKSASRLSSRFPATSGLIFNSCVYVNMKSNIDLQKQECAHYPVVIPPVASGQDICRLNASADLGFRQLDMSEWQRRRNI